MKCPFDQGELLYWHKPPSYHPWFCPNNDTHGGNGRFYSTKELEEFVQVDKLIVDSVQAVMNGDMSSEDAVKIIARRENKPAPMIRARLAEALRVANRLKDVKSARKAAPIAAVVHGSPTPRSGGTVAPDVFMGVLKEHGLTKKQAAEAIGRSVSRVHELTVTKGGSESLLETFKLKLSQYNKNV